MLEEQLSIHYQPRMRGAQLCFISPCGTHWSVEEVPDSSTDSGRALIFESEGCWRRVRRFPADWRDLDAHALWDLSWSR